MIALPRSVQLAIACCGIFFSFSYFAVLQEDVRARRRRWPRSRVRGLARARVTRLLYRASHLHRPPLARAPAQVYKTEYNGERFRYTFLALIAERGINALIGLLGVMCLGGSGLTIPHRDIFVSGISQMLAMAGSNEALRYVSYPTQVLGKSCKMVPVMAGGIVLGGKRYSAFEYLQVVLITVGVCVFNLAGKKKKGAEDSALGLMLIGFSLVMDAVTGGLQDKVKKRTKELNPESGEKPVPTMHGALPRAIGGLRSCPRDWLRVVGDRGGDCSGAAAGTAYRHSAPRQRASTARSGTARSGTNDHTQPHTTAHDHTRPHTTTHDRTRPHTTAHDRTRPHTMPLARHGGVWPSQSRCCGRTSRDS